ncbi:NADPH:quinone reductase-like Zn-dependent oxidoreductase [Kribbella sp. VKM Ac-2527]|uniref:NADPH:quinone reductase-like Zn-dependent oxidoreductase n=1 Tax=Kribbella caucasensis TaxID=2512215 RepID=A0A4R6K6N4_9ACTN|nr:NAD(P)-dependent alcohol dehydrogenase [Kribbella sp. VKM Ac-2527]TDO45230.1 NADPH:quinone reductase-like Zn-dependent oxidoreductase [Kribbella sp. VKM Ac-2527]
MKAIVQERYGPPEVLEVGEVAKPAPADDEVVIRVRAASVNARDWHVMRGDPYVARLMDRSTFGNTAPRDRIRGTDFAGEVDAVGRSVQGLRVGDEVYGEAPGAFAEYVKAPAQVVALKPSNLSFEEAAAMPLAANTALMCLRDAAQVESGMRVLINGASGGVGTFAVQLAVAFGAAVTGVCSTRNADLVRSLGADEIVDYTREDFTWGGARYDVVVDLVGNKSLSRLRRVLVPGGTLVLSGGGVSRGGSMIGPVGLMIRGQAMSKLARGHRITIPAAVPSQAKLTTLRELAESGKLKPVIDRTFPLTQAAEAVRYVEDEHARAKVVLTV